MSVCLRWVRGLLHSFKPAAAKHVSTADDRTQLTTTFVADQLTVGGQVSCGHWQVDQDAASYGHTAQCSPRNYSRQINRHSAWQTLAIMQFVLYIIMLFVHIQMRELAHATFADSSVVNFDFNHDSISTYQHIGATVDCAGDSLCGFCKLNWPLVIRIIPQLKLWSYCYLWHLLASIDLLCYFNASELTVWVDNTLRSQRPCRYCRIQIWAQ